MGGKPFEGIDPARRRNMAAIRSKDTKPEAIVRSALHRLGYRFRANAKDLPGRPDIAFTRRKIAVFIHGCFWHAHAGCSHAPTPKTRASYWGPKLTRNVERDAEKARSLEALGWHVYVLWECELRYPQWLPRLVTALGLTRCVRQDSLSGRSSS